jgi:hypothetical protein
MASLGLHDPVMVQEIVKEIEMSRDMNSFNSQTVVMIAAAVSRLLPIKPDTKNKETIEGLWESIMMRSCQIHPSDMQTNWPDVLLTSVAFSGIRKESVRTEFVRRMVQDVLNQFKGDRINVGRIAKAVDALLRIGAETKQVDRLRILC